MQFVEASSFAARSAVIQLRRPGTPLGFVLFPMIHLATPAFYADVMTSLAGCLVPAFGIGLLVFGSREFLARCLGSQEDLPTREEELGYGRVDALTDLLVDDRDALLTRALDAIHQQRSKEPISVAVVYGAGHMPAVVRYLARYGYRASSAEWLTVFEY